MSRQRPRDLAASGVEGASRPKLGNCWFSYLQNEKGSSHMQARPFITNLKPKSANSPAGPTDRSTQSTSPADILLASTVLRDPVSRSSTLVRSAPLEWLGSDFPPTPPGILRQRVPTDWPSYCSGMLFPLPKASG